MNFLLEIKGERTMVTFLIAPNGGFVQKISVRRIEKMRERQRTLLKTHSIEGTLRSSSYLRVLQRNTV